MLALVRYEKGICKCGFHTSITGDKSNHFTFETKTCNFCAASAKWDRVQADADKKAAKALGDDPAPMSPRPADGRSTYIRLMSLEEVEKRRASRASGPGPVRPHEQARDLKQGNHAHKKRQGEKAAT